MRPVVVINVVGLTPAMVGPDTPCIAQVAQQGFVCPLETVVPAVTCTVQATFLTGRLPREHGIVANGWYFRDLAQVWFWRQSNHLIQAPKLYELARQRDPQHTTAKLFWWYNMYAPVRWSVTPRPCYAADGRKLPDTYSNPPDLKDWLQQELGIFPLFRYWGPGADITSTAWIAQATVRVLRRYRPWLTLVYLPHLDYNLQRLGPQDPRIRDDLRLVDAEAGKVIQAAQELGAQVVVLSEYAITEVSQPVHINRVLREHGYLQVRRERLGRETLDAGASRAFAVADHQLAHVYLQRPEDVLKVKRLLQQTPGIERVWDRQEQRAVGLDHPRSGELVALAAPGAWFTYYYWLDDRLAPDFARTVDIHRKPGYDPVELFLDPRLRWPRVRIAWRLLQKWLGFRTLMDVIGLDASVVRGSHGRVPEPGAEDEQGPVFICSEKRLACPRLHATEVMDFLLRLQFDT